MKRPGWKPPPDPTAGLAYPKRQERPPTARKPTLPDLIASGQVTYGSALEAQPKPMPALRCRAYLDWLTTLPCLVVGCEVSPVDPHHEGPRGVGQKTDDPLAVPLCRLHHDYVEFHLHLPDMTRQQTDLLIYKQEALLFVRWLKETGAWVWMQEAGILPPAKREGSRR